MGTDKRTQGHLLCLTDFIQNSTGWRPVVAAYQWWPRTSGGRLRFAHAITHLLRQSFGHFVNSNK